MVETVVFLLLSSFLFVGAGAVVLARSPYANAFGFFVASLAVAGLFALLHLSFLFLAQILVSVGAVVVLTLIVVLTINLREEKTPGEPLKWLWILASALVAAPFGWLLYRALASMAVPFGEVPDTFGDAKATGLALFGDWVLPFELLSILLLAAMVGAIVIGRKEQSYDIES